MAVTARRVYRGELLHFLRDPKKPGTGPAFEHFPDGVLLVENGHVLACGPAQKLLRGFPKNLPVRRFKDSIILPGFVDCHVHFSQLEAIAGYGEQLLDWLTRHAYPAEAKFGDSRHARAVARIFLKELLRNGTTAALAFATVHPESAEALFETAAELDMRIISGKVLMDRNAPKALLDTPRSAYRDSQRLIERWHGKKRLLYAITPRFAPTSSECQLKVAQRLLQEFPDVYLHTHLSENKNEVAWVRALFPEYSGYLDVYDRHQFTGPRSVFAHCVQLTGPEWTRLGETGSAAAFCPSSNLFLGSGLFDAEKAAASGVRVGIGTDVGAGTSLSMLRNLDEAYKIAQLRGQTLSPLRAFYLATLGGAEALSLDAKIGNFLPGREADFTVLDWNATPLLSYRMKTAKTLEDRLFLLMTLGDDRAVRATAVIGALRHERS